MAVRTAWKGTLKVGLAMVPCRMVAVTEPSEKVKFNRLHDACHHRINEKNWCPTCNLDLTRDELVRGYEIPTRKGDFIVVADAELEAFDEGASSVLDINAISDREIDPAYIDGTMYLIPADEAGAQRPFDTLRIALGSRIAVGTVVLRKRNITVALQAADAESAFIVYKLRSASQVRTFDDLGLPPAAEPDKRELTLAKALMNGMEGDWSYADIEDTYTAQLKDFLAAKDAAIRAGAAVTPTPVRKALSGPSFADALEASLKVATPAPVMAKAAIAPKAAKSAAGRRKSAAA